MKGLMKKDFLMLWRASRAFLLICVVFIAVHADHDLRAAAVDAAEL